MMATDWIRIGLTPTQTSFEQEYMLYKLVDPSTGCEVIMFKDHTVARNCPLNDEFYHEADMYDIALQCCDVAYKIDRMRTCWTNRWRRKKRAELEAFLSDLKKLQSLMGVPQ